MALRWNGTAVQVAVYQAAQEALERTADELKRKANETVPYASSVLAQSAQVDMAPNKATVSYSAPYAIRQHEDLSLRHPDPTNPQSSPRGRARWLELTAQEEARHLTTWFAQQLRGGV